MWEKIVLNLLSNAFKFTFEGEIAGLGCASTADAAVLEVRDTGTGIPAAELPRLFERFHRVEGARGRSHRRHRHRPRAGAGAGQAARRRRSPSRASRARHHVHGTHPVRRRAPAGRAHPGDARQPRPRCARGAYVEEALRWLPGRATPQARGRQPRKRRRAAHPARRRQRRHARLRRGGCSPRTTRSRRWRTAAQALAAARAQPPDLVLTDVMMPGLDGFGLLRALRADPQAARRSRSSCCRRAPARRRASRASAAGADDYLVKPFARASCWRAWRRSSAPPRSAARRCTSRSARPRSCARKRARSRR